MRTLSSNSGHFVFGLPISNDVNRNGLKQYYRCICLVYFFTLDYFIRNRFINRNATNDFFVLFIFNTFLKDIYNTSKIVIKLFS